MANRIYKKICDFLSEHRETVDTLRAPALFAAGILIGYLSWYAGPVGLAAAFPVVWMMGTRNRNDQFVLALGYYLAGSAVIPGAAGGFFGIEYTSSLGLLLWVGTSLALAIPWMLLRASPLSLLTALVLITLPPLGIIGWLSPLLAAADIFPGSGFLGLLVLIASWALLPACRLRKRRLMVFTILLISTSLATYIANGRQANHDYGWKGVETRLPVAPTSLLLRLNRQMDLLLLTDKELRSGAPLVVLPEQITGLYTPPIANYWANQVHYLPWDKHKEQLLFVGISAPSTKARGHFSNGLSVWQNGKLAGYLTARQTVPLSMWQPWNDGKVGVFHSPADYFKTNTVSVPSNQGQKKVTVLFCYEELLSFPVLTSFMFSRPEGIIAVANSWWASDEQQQVQKRHSLAWARLFGVPITRATNAPANIVR